MNEIQIEQLRSRLEGALRSLPEGFYDTFEFTTTGNTLCHSITLSLIAKVLGEMDGVGYVGVDVKLNDGGGVKFQPDVVGFGNAESLGRVEPVIFVDFESPNSSDGRVPNYHLPQYMRWIKVQEHKAPYVVITSVPDAPAPKWKLLYAGPKGLNFVHKAHLNEIRRNPFRYWKAVWAKELCNQSGLDMSGVFFLNINGRQVVRFRMQ